MTARPAPLTPEQRCSKRVPLAGVWFRDAQCSRKAVGVFDGAPLYKQHSPEAKAARDAKYEAKFRARLARDRVPLDRLSEALAELDATRAQLAAVTLERNEAATSSNHLRLVLAQSLTAWEPKHNHAGGTDDCMVCVARGALDATKHFDFAISPTQPTPTEWNES